MKKTEKIKVYLSDEAWAYDGVYQKIGELPGVSDTNLKLWTMLGALMHELNNSTIIDVIVYNDTRMVEEWNEQIKFESKLSQAIAVKLKNGLLKKFINFKIVKESRGVIDSQIKTLQLT